MHCQIIIVQRSTLLQHPKRKVHIYVLPSFGRLELLKFNCRSSLLSLFNIRHILNPVFLLILRYNFHLIAWETNLVWVRYFNNVLKNDYFWANWMSDIFMKARKEVFKPLIQSEARHSSPQYVIAICRCTNKCDQEETLDVKNHFNIVRRE